MIWSIAWRNIWRNKLRSLVVLSAIAIGIFAGVFTWAFYRGMVNQRIQNAIASESSHIQVHDPRYLTDPDQKYTIRGLDSIRNLVTGIPAVRAASARILANAMITSAETGSGVKVAGIDPEQEKNVSNLWTRITSGTYFEGRSRTPLVMGEALARKLSVHLHSRVVITLQAMDGTLATGLFRVEGIYRTTNTTYDEMNVFVRSTDLSDLMALEPGTGHELAVLLRRNEALDSVRSEMAARLPALDCQTWKEIMPEVSLVETSMDFSMYIFLGVILAALVFGIINTMLMAVLERTREIGMLMALGMNKPRIFRMILYETVMLSLTGGLAGMAAGYLITLFFSHQGIDLSRFAEAYARLGYDSLIYPVPSLGIDFRVAVMVFVTGLIASLYPAWKAIQFKPAETLHMDN